MIRNNHWYNLNEQHDYPLDATASCVSNAGLRLPTPLIADLKLRWNNELGKYAFISSVSCTEHIITVMIEAVDTLDNVANNSVLIAGISVPKAELTPYRTYRLDTFKPGVAGFIAFGAGTDELFTGSFSSPLQSRLTAKAAWPVRKSPVNSLGILHVQSVLNGLVGLQASEPLEIVKEPRIINGIPQDNVIVFRLKESIIAGAEGVPSVFSDFAGPCGRRVGSRSCIDPQPIETINGLTADCDGVLTIEFQGCAVVGKNNSDCGVVVDCYRGLSDTCAPPYLPELETGKLPSEVPPVIIPPPPPEPPQPPPENSLSDSLSTVLELPYCDTFDDGFAYGFSAMSGSTWDMSADDSPEEAFCCIGPPPNYTAFGCDSSFSESQSISVGVSSFSYGTENMVSVSRTNISLFTLDIQSLYRKYSTDFKVVELALGSGKNAGIIVNYRINSADLYTYIYAALDIETKIFGVYFFNGINSVPLSTVDVQLASTDQWYHLELAVTPNEITRTSVNLVATLKGIDEPLVDVAVSTSLSSVLWEEDAGNAGFYTRRSSSYFSYWRVDEQLA
jgi:hypothetical protein